MKRASAVGLPRTLSLFRLALRCARTSGSRPASSPVPRQSITFVLVLALLAGSLPAAAQGPGAEEAALVSSAAAISVISDINTTGVSMAPDVVGTTVVGNTLYFAAFDDAPVGSCGGATAPPVMLPWSRTSAPGVFLATRSANGLRRHAVLLCQRLQQRARALAERRHRRRHDDGRRRVAGPFRLLPVGAYRGRQPAVFHR